MRAVMPDSGSRNHDPCLDRPCETLSRRETRYSSQSEENYLAEMWSGSEEGSYLRLIDCCIPQL